MMSCRPGDKTASVVTSWTMKVLNSRRRRRRVLEFRSSASAARRPTPAAPRNVTPVLVMLQKFLTQSCEMDAFFCHDESYLSRLDVYTYLQYAFQNTSRFGASKRRFVSLFLSCQVWRGGKGR